MVTSNQIHTIYRAEHSKRNKDPKRLIIDSSKKYLEVENGEWTLAGHDSTLVVKNVGENPQQYLLGVADGHGIMGDSFSYIAIHILANELKKTINPIKKLIKNQTLENAQLKINDICKSAYVNTHELMCTKSIFPHLDRYSGTTMAMAMILMIDNNRYLISTNAGDSQILWSNSYDSVEECSMDHNCDNPKAVHLYIQRMAKLRQIITDQIENECDGDECHEIDDLKHKRNKLLPKPIYYSRINCPGGPKWPIYDDNGIPCPIEVYEYGGDNQEELNLNKINYEKVSQYYPHGQQSIRFPETYIREDGRVVAKPGSEMDNWGSTLAGGGQTLNGFGDLHEFPHRSVHPHVLVKPINETGKLIIASDGLTDLFYFNNLMKWFWEQTEDIDTNFYQHIFNKSKNHEQFEYTTIDSTKYPKWDDLCGVFISLGKYQTTEQIVYQHQLNNQTTQYIIDIQPSPTQSTQSQEEEPPNTIDDLIIDINESTTQTIIDNDRLVNIAKCIFNYGYE